jgi:hypothetical protein
VNGLRVRLANCLIKIADVVSPPDPVEVELAGTFEGIDLLASYVKWPGSVGETGLEGLTQWAKDATAKADSLQKLVDGYHDGLWNGEPIADIVAERDRLRNNPLCNNCGVPLTTKSGVVVHLAGPQKGMTTCALNPYGTYMADDGNYFSTAVSDD